MSEAAHLLSDLFLSTSSAGNASQVADETITSVAFILRVWFSCILFSYSCQML